MIDTIVEMSVVFTVDEKRKQLKMRKEEHRKLSKEIDTIVRQAQDKHDGVSPGCFTSFLRMITRSGRRSEQQHNSFHNLAETVSATASAMGEMSAVHESTVPTSADSSLKRAIFGLAGSKKSHSDPVSKLEQAAAVMRARIESLEKRALEQRRLALQLQKSGQKAQALRALKKARAVDVQISSNCSALDAVEQQCDLLATAHVQKELTNALASTSKSMKKDGKALERAESAIDDAAEVRDIVGDLGAAMAEFANGASLDIDEEDLEAELLSMMEADIPPEPPASAVKAEAERVEAGYREAEEAHMFAQNAPSVPTSKKKKTKAEERAGLLEAGV